MSGSTQGSDLSVVARDYQPKTRKIIIAAMKAGIRYRITKNGVMFYGNNGQNVLVHRTESDPRAEKNTIARFKRIGFDPKGKQ